MRKGLVVFLCKEYLFQKGVLIIYKSLQYSIVFEFKQSTNIMTSQLTFKMETNSIKSLDTYRNDPKFSDR